MTREPNRVQILEQLQRIFTSEEFQSSPRKQKFLRYIVEKTLDGQAAGLKGYSIGVDVFDRGDSFDPQNDTIVRVQALNLRRALDLYYLTYGQSDLVRIEIPKGRYVPKFSFIETGSADDADSNAPNIKKAITVEESSPALSPEISNETPNRIRWIIGIAAAAIATLLIIFSLSGFGNASDGFEQAKVLPAGPSVAIMPFEIIGSTNFENGQFDLINLQAGLQIELLGKVSRFKNLLVIEVPTDYEDQAVEEMRKYDTQFLLTGSIQQSSGMVRITSVLTRRATGRVLWTKSYEEDLNQLVTLLEFQANIAVDVASSLGQPSGSINKKFIEEYSRLNDLQLDHYTCLMRFYDYLNKKSAQKHFEVRACLERATKEVPKFSSGWAALSWMYTDEGSNNFNLRTESAPPKQRAVAAGQRAVDADPDNAMAHQYLAGAKFMSGDDLGFLESAETALKLNPNDPEVLAAIGDYLNFLGRSEQGIPMLKKAIMLNPGQTTWYNGSLTLHYYLENEMETALSHARIFIQNDSLSAHIMYTVVLIRSGHIEEGKRAYQKLIGKYPFFPDRYEQILRGRRAPEGLYDKVVEDLKTAGLGQSISTP